MKTLKRTFSIIALSFFFISFLTAQVDRPTDNRGDVGKPECDDWWVGACGPGSSIYRTGNTHIGAIGNAISGIKFQVTGNAFISKGYLYGLDNNNGFVIKAGTPAVEGSYIHLRSIGVNDDDEVGTGNISSVLRGEAPRFRVMYNEGSLWQQNFAIYHTGEMIGRRSLQLNTAESTIPFRVKTAQWGEDRFAVRSNGETFSKSFRVGPSFWNPQWDHFKIQEDGKVIVGDAAAASEGFLLSVAEGIQTQQIKVCASANNWCDYVFAEDYKLNPIEKVEAHIKEFKHLPNVPSAQEVEENGINVAEMDATLLRQVEELWLHVIDLKKENEELKKLINESNN